MSGIYTVCHEISLAGSCSDEVCEDIEICIPADFAGPSVICQGMPATFVSLNNNGVLSYEWSFNGVVESNEMTFTKTVDIIVDTHIVHIKITDGFCTSEHTQTLTVIGEPDAGFTSTASGNTYSFTPDIIDPNTDYLWDFGDGNTSTETIPTHTYTELGEYLVNLTVTNDCGEIHHCEVVRVCDLQANVLLGQGALCVGQQGVLVASVQGSGTSFTYEWSVNDTFVGNGNTQGVTWTQVGNNIVTLVVTDEFGCTDTVTQTFNVILCGDVIGEVDDLVVGQQSLDQWNTVTLDNSYSRPVVVMSVASFNDINPITVRVRNVQSNSFEYQIDEWDYQDGFHAIERISYMVVEQGIHTLSNGAKIVAGNTRARGTWSNVPFGNFYTFDDTPVAFTQCITTTNQQALTTRISNLTPSSFRIALQKEESSNTLPTIERVSVILMEQGMEDIGTKFEMRKAVNSVTEEWMTLDFDQSYSSEAIFLAKAQTADDTDPITLRARNLTGASIRVVAQEEQSADYEVVHNPEAIGYAIFDHASDIIGTINSGKTMAINPFEVAEEIEEVTVEIDCSIMPNPNNGQFVLEINSEQAETANLTLTDVSGKVIWTQTNINLEGHFKKQLNIEEYPTGIYLLNVRSENVNHTEKVLVY